MRRRLIAAAAALLAACPGLAQDAGRPVWRPLFDGRSLAGWTQHGGKAEYRVEDETIVGRTVAATPNSFLCTDREYGDFELSVLLKVDPAINSGIQIRSHVRENNDRVYGLQVEIDPSDRAWSAGLYDEARRGWQDDLRGQPDAQAAFFVDGWNHYRVRCFGDHLQTWVNGVPAADLVDSLDLSGLIALQVHGVGRDQAKVGREVCWREVRIRELGRHAWQPLWNGQDLAGFTARGGGTWRVEHGVLVGKSAASEPSHGVLLTDTQWSDFTARLEYRCVRGNSGFYFRSVPVDGAVTVHGFQAEMDPDASRPNGGLYETGGRGWVVEPKDSGYRPDAWNTLTVSAKGRRITVHLNGKRTAELLDDPGRARGHLGVQLHGGQDMRVEVRKLELLRPVP